jgi:hypothetical protein
VLHVDGPVPEYADKLMLFGRFVGSWHLEWTGTDASGGPATMSGELHFGWVLGGRAVQDVWIVPGRGQPGAGQPPLASHGSTIRFYDPAISFTWRAESSHDKGSTWHFDEQMLATRDISALSAERGAACGGPRPG